MNHSQHTPQLHQVLPPLNNSWETYAVNLDAQGGCWRLARHPDGSAGTFVRFDLKDNHAEWHLNHLPFEPDGVQPLSQQRILVYEVRCEFSSKPNPNGLILDHKGQIQSGLVLGDGISHVQVCNDVIWCSYFDEGIFGNLGWDGDEPPKRPIGHSGLVAFDLTGKVIFEYDPPPHSEVCPYICDCYSMNVVSNHEVWICPYTDFPLVKTGLNHDYHI